MPLTDITVRQAKAKNRPYKLSDAGGLYLLVQPNGSRLWRLKYRFDGREKTLALGAYPAIKLVDARGGRDTAKLQLAAGEDPSAAKRSFPAPVAIQEPTFRELANEYMDRRRKESAAEKTITKTEWLLTFANADFGERAMTSLKAADILVPLKKLEAKGRLESAKRMRGVIGQVFRFAVATQRAERNVAVDLVDATMPPRVEHRAAILDPKEIGPLMRAISSYRGMGITRFALALAPLVFVRPGELRKAEWSEIEGIDGDEPTWRIPAKKMKMRRAHVVPLSKQAVAVLKAVHAVTGCGRYVFPSIRGADRPLGEMALNSAFRRLGYTKEEVTAHGLRRTASTILHESGFNSDLIERQLAHVDLNKVRSVYNAAEHLPERRAMMQWWGDYLERARKGERTIAELLG